MEISLTWVVVTLYGISAIPLIRFYQNNLMTIIEIILNIHTNCDLR